MTIRNLILTPIAIVLVAVVLYILVSPEEAAEGPGTVEQSRNEPTEDTGPVRN